MNTFSEFLFLLRKERNMTQAELAEKLGITNKAVSKWETGEAMPETSLLAPLASIFGVTVDELLNGRRAESGRQAEDREKEILRGARYGHLFHGSERPYFGGAEESGAEYRNNLIDKICGVVCGCTVAAGMAAFLLIGFLTGMWHPYWVVLVASCASCGIVGIIFDMCNRPKCEWKMSRGENPYTGGACGIVVLLCVIVYLFIGSFFGLWHPGWIIIMAGIIVCIVLGSVGSLFIKDKKDK